MKCLVGSFFGAQRNSMSNACGPKNRNSEPILSGLPVLSTILLISSLSLILRLSLERCRPKWFLKTNQMVLQKGPQFLRSFVILPGF